MEKTFSNHEVTHGDRVKFWTNYNKALLDRISEIKSEQEPKIKKNDDKRKWRIHKTQIHKSWKGILDSWRTREMEYSPWPKK